MSTEDRLTPELAELENRLRNLAPTASTVDREALMYRAGWEAAEAALQTRRFSTAKLWIWPATSAALAATLLLVLTLRPERAERSARLQQQMETQVAPPQPIDTGKTQAAPPVQVRNQTTPTMTRQLNRYAPTAPLLAMRERALRFDFEDPTADAISDDGPIAASTNRELLEEYLPAPTTTNPTSQRRPWWSFLRIGESA